MIKKLVVSSSKPTGYSRSTSIGSSSSSSSNSNRSAGSSSSSTSAIPSPPSSELCALIGFAYKLGSVVHNNDPNMDGSNSDVRREAKLLMSLSCSSPDDEMSGDICSINNNNDNKQSDGETATMASTASLSTTSTSTASSSGRITPTHSITSTSSAGSRRDTFCFTCPSLSLDNTRGTTGGNSPGILLSRTLKVDDKDAMRLSSEAMARNIIESFQKAIVWRIQSWVDSLSRVLVMKEMKLKNTGTTKAMRHLLQQGLYFSKEALLVKTLREIEGKVQVLEATTAFKVLNKVSQVDETGAALKKRRMGEGEEKFRIGLEEGEYVYDVIHLLEMQCALNVSTPAGNVRIDLNVPGKINGTFFSSEDDDCDDKLTDVTIDLNTDMMASMIEKSSRVAVRASSEAMLKGDLHKTPVLTKAPQVQSTPTYSKPATTSVTASRLSTRSPKRKATESNVLGQVVITPGRVNTSAPSSYGESSDSDGDHHQPILLRIPDSFPPSETLLQPQVSRVGKMTSPGMSLDFAARLPPKKFMLLQKQAAAVITPLKTKGPEYIEREKGPNLPILLEAAGIRSKK